MELSAVVANKARTGQTLAGKTVKGPEATTGVNELARKTGRSRGAIQLDKKRADAIEPELMDVVIEAKLQRQGCGELIATIANKNRTGDKFAGRKVDGPAATTGLNELSRKSGRSKRSIQDARNRAANLEPELLDAVAGSSVAKGVNLDALMGALHGYRDDRYELNAIVRITRVGF